jgi:hypothetical protein
MKLHRSRAAAVGVCCALVGAAVVPVAGLAGITGSTGDGPMVLQSGESSVTYQAGVNIGSLVATSFRQIWSRTGDTVTLSGVIPVQPAAINATSSVYIPVPAAADSNITSRFDCVGSGTVTPPTDDGAQIQGSEASGHSHQCVVNWVAHSTALQFVHYTMSYRVRD